MVIFNLKLLINNGEISSTDLLSLKHVFNFGFVL